MDIVNDIASVNPSFILFAFAAFYAAFWFLGRYGYMLALSIILIIAGSLLLLPGGQTTINATRQQPDLEAKARCLGGSLIMLSPLRDGKIAKSCGKLRVIESDGDGRR